MTAEEAMARISELVGGYIELELNGPNTLEQITGTVFEWQAAR